MSVQPERWQAPQQRESPAVFQTFPTFLVSVKHVEHGERKRDQARKEKRRKRERREEKLKKLAPWIPALRSGTHGAQKLWQGDRLLLFSFPFSLHVPFPFSFGRLYVLWARSMYSSINSEANSQFNKRLCFVYFITLVAAVHIVVGVATTSWQEWHTSVLGIDQSVKVVPSPSLSPVPHQWNLSLCYPLHSHPLCVCLLGVVRAVQGPSE